MENIEKRFICKSIGQKAEKGNTVTHTFLVAHDAIDRDDEVIPIDVLTSLSEQLPGKGVFKNHDTQDLREGTVTKSWVHNLTEGDFVKLTSARPRLRIGQSNINVLYADADFAKDTDIANKLKAKIVGSVSIGFYFQNWPVEKEDYRIHMLPVEADEFSIVETPAMPGAQMIKSGNKNKHKGESNMDDLIQVQKELVNTQNKLDNSDKALKAANNQIDDLTKEVNELKLLAEMGRKYQESVTNDLVTLKIKAGDLKDEGKTGFEKLAKELPLEYKINEIKTLKQRLEKSYQPEMKMGSPGYENPMIEEVNE